MTYAKDGRVIGDLRTRWSLGSWGFADVKILDIRSTEDNVLKDVVVGRDLLCRITTTTFSTIRLDYCKEIVRLLAYIFDKTNVMIWCLCHTVLLILGC